jgi:hypothetical protein
VSEQGITAAKNKLAEAGIESTDDAKKKLGEGVDDAKKKLAGGMSKFGFGKQAVQVEEAVAQ